MCRQSRFSFRESRSRCAYDKTERNLHAVASVSFAARADSGIIHISVLKGGWFIGASGGSGVLYFHGRRYRLSVGGLDAGFVFGASQTYLSGTVSNIYRPSDVAGVYGAGGAGAAVGTGVRAIVLTNEKGAVLQLSGRQTGRWSMPI